MYEPGETVIRYCDIFPASVTPWVAPLPVRANGEAQSVMLRVVVTERFLSIAWQWGQSIAPPLHIPIEPEEAALVSLGGGSVGGWMIGRRTGCRCNARLLSTWDPYPGVHLVAPVTVVDAPRDSSWGVVPARYSRAW
jgi:hypothetical protein